MSKGIRGIAIEHTLSKIQIDVDTNPHLESIVDKSNFDQYKIIEIINLAFKNVIRDTVAKGEDITLPYIGMLKIKSKNRIALKNKKIIAEELGYNDFKLIPKAQLDEAKDKVRQLITSDLLAQKANGAVKRVSHQKLPKSKSKVLTFVRK